jgi:putative flippase GtrA
VAYTITYIAGIVLAYLVNATWVFNSRMTLNSALLYPAVYLIQYLASVCILSLLVEQFGVGKKIAPLIVIILVYPLAFIMNRLLFKRPKQYGTE